MNSGGVGGRVGELGARKVCVDGVEWMGVLVGVGWKSGGAGGGGDECIPIASAPTP